MLHSHHLLSHFFPLPSLPRSHHHPFSSPLPHYFRSNPFGGRTTFRAARLRPWLAELPEASPPPPEAEEGGGGGPIEIPSSAPSPLFAVDDNPSPLQVATSVLLTGAISIFLFRSVRRRARRAKELRVRSTGLKKTKDLKEEALDSLKAMGSSSLEAGGPPSPAQAFLGGIAAGAIAVILYKFTTTIEASLNRQTISDNFSVRQITITIRTIINGLCYLATFVFGINSVGLILYSGQLAISSFMGDSSSNSTSGKTDDGQLNVMGPTKSSTENVEVKRNEVQQSSDDS